VPFLRFSRDKRGYEHTYLVHATNRRGKPTRPRILYWYRTPPGVRLGRVPFPEEVRRAIEAQHPGIAFDWDTLANTPFPSQEPEFWRERRRAEKAAKQARREEEASDAPEPSTPADVDLDDAPGAAASGDGGDHLPGDERSALSADEPVAESGGEGSEGAAAANGEGALPHKRRRRRGGKRRRGRSAGLAAGEQGQAEPAGAELASHEQIIESDPSSDTDSASEDQE
jgi:hypothetical protein